MNAAIVRRLVLVVCVVGIAGMIVTNIAGNTGGSITFGLITAVAVLCSIVATAVTTSSRPSPSASGVSADEHGVDEVGTRLEERIEALVESGADEEQVRALVADAVHLGKLVR